MESLCINHLRKCVGPLLQKAMTAKPCWLSHGSPAITALSDEEADGTVEEVEDEEYSTE